MVPVLLKLAPVENDALLVRVKLLVLLANSPSRWSSRFGWCHLQRQGCRIRRDVRSAGQIQVAGQNVGAGGKRGAADLRQVGRLEAVARVNGQRASIAKAGRRGRDIVARARDRQGLGI